MESVRVVVALLVISTVKCRGSLDVSTCGRSKGCWFMPPDCTYGNPVERSNCTTIVTWRMNEPYLTLEFDAQMEGLSTSPFSGRYVALAFSKDGFMAAISCWFRGTLKIGRGCKPMHNMDGKSIKSYNYFSGDDSVVECVAKADGRIDAYISFNDEKSNSRLVEASVLLTTNASGEVVDDRLICRFNRLLHHKNTKEIPGRDYFKIFDLRQNAYILQIARGRTKAGEGYELGIHSTNDGPLFPWMTTEYVKLSDNVIISSSSMKQTTIPRSVQYNMVKVHGIFMVFGWWVFGSLAMLLSRFAKHSWPSFKLCGTALWFQLHRGFMVTSVVLQVVAFVLVFVQAWSLKTCSYSCNTDYFHLKLHTILGIICTVAAVIQPFLAMLRPAPTSPKRSIFNWTHWLIGTTSWIIACVTIFLSSNIGKSGLRRNFGYQPDAIMISYLISFVVASLLLEILSAYYAENHEQGNSKATMMLNSPHSPKPNTKDIVVNKNLFQTSVLIVFAIFAVCLCITLAYMIAMNRLL